MYCTYKLWYCIVEFLATNYNTSCLIAYRGIHIPIHEELNAWKDDNLYNCPTFVSIANVDERHGKY